MSKEAVYKLKTQFDVYATEWGLNENIFGQICSVLGDELQMDQETLIEAGLALFGVYDTDKNGSVEALEFLASIAFCSAMEDSEKLNFIFGLYDFCDASEVGKDACTLSLRTTLVGLNKISGSKGRP